MLGLKSKVQLQVKHGPFNLDTEKGGEYFMGLLIHSLTGFMEFYICLIYIISLI